MKHIFTYLLGIFSVLLATFGCIRHDNLLLDTSIELSQTEISVPRAGDELLIEVQTNNADWSFVSSAEGKWLTLSKEENNLRVEVEQNPLSVKRTAIIIIASGNIQKEISITQESSDIQLELIGGKNGTLEIKGIPSKGATRRVDFFTNSEEIEVELDSDSQEWILVKDKDENGLVIDIKENTSRLARKGSVIIRSGNAQQTLFITQEGTLYYVLPLIQKEVTLNQAITFEKQRGGTINRLPSDNSQQNIYRLNVASPIAEMVQYQYDRPNLKLYNEAFVLYKNKNDIVDNPEFDQFMNDMGFTQKGMDPTNRFVRYHQDPEKDLGFMAQIANFGDRGAAVFITMGVRQNTPQPTFSQFPLRQEITYLGAGPVIDRQTGTMINEPVAGLLKMKYVIDEYNEDTEKGKGHYLPGGIFEREINAGATFREKKFWDDPYLGWYSFLRPSTKEIAEIEYSTVTDADYEGIFSDEINENGKPRWKHANPEKYKYLLDDVFRIIGITSGTHFSKIFFQTAVGEIGLTKEFIALMEREGFTHTFEEEGFYFFFNKNLGVSLVLSEIDDLQIWLDTERSKRADNSSQTSALKMRNFSAYDKEVKARKKYISEIKERIKKYQKNKLKRK